MKRGFVDTPDGQIHYISDGSGEPIVCLHMTPISSWEFTLVLPILAKKYRAIAMDTLGYGDSDKPPRRYEMSDYARSVVDFLDALGINKTSLVGWHTGAGIAGEVAASYPERVDKLVLSGYPLYTQEMLEARKKEPPANIRVIEPLNLKEDGAHMIAAWNQARKYLGTEASVEDVHAMTVAILQSGPRNAEAHLALWHYGDQGGAEKRLALIKCPTLVLTTPKDVFYFHIEAVKNPIPRNKVTVIGKDAPTSYLPAVAAAEYTKAIMDFMENPGV